MESWSIARTGEMAAARKSASLVMSDAEGKPVARYRLENAWPSKTEVGGLKGGSARFRWAITIVSERIERISR